MQPNNKCYLIDPEKITQENMLIFLKLHIRAMNIPVELNLKDDPDFLEFLKTDSNGDPIEHEELMTAVIPLQFF